MNNETQPAKYRKEMTARLQAMSDEKLIQFGEAAKAHMKIHGVDRETSRYWIDSAMGGT